MSANMFREVYARFNLHKAGRNWRGDCPVCGYPDSFILSRAHNGNVIGWCASCQNNAAVAAILRGAGAGDDTAERDNTAMRAKAADAKRNRQERAHALLTGAAPVQANDPAGKYLTSRGLGAFISSPAFRYRADCPHPSERWRYDALLCRINDVHGEIIGVQRIFINRDGTKANAEPRKASLGQTWGGAIRLTPAASEIVVGEGAETSASAGLLLGLPAWAAISAGNLATGLALPPKVRSIVIAADDDSVNAQGRNPGIEAAEAAARRWQAEGRKVRIIKPNTPGQDFNDVLTQRAATEAA